MITGDSYSILFQAVVISFGAGALLPLAFKEGKRASAISFGLALLGSLLAIVLSVYVLLARSL